MEYRYAKLDDLQQITEIEANTMSCPWSFENFKEALYSDHSIFIVAAEDEAVTGYTLLYLSPPEAELPDIVVASVFRRQGIAKGLLQKAIQEARKKGVLDIFLEVRESNYQAKALYDRFGFKNIGIRKNFYTNPSENAICMKLSV